MRGVIFVATRTIPYSEKLKDPRWQRKRLEILQRDDFACCKCLSTTETLHVHHGYYEKGLEPWEYDDDTLWTLCESCHETVSEIAVEVAKSIGRVHPSWLEWTTPAVEDVNFHGGYSPFWTLFFEIYRAAQPRDGDFQKLHQDIRQELVRVCQKFGYDPKI